MANYCKTIFGEALLTELLDKYPVSTSLLGSQNSLFCFLWEAQQSSGANHISRKSVRGKILCWAAVLSLHTTLKPIHIICKHAFTYSSQVCAWLYVCGWVCVCSANRGIVTTLNKTSTSVVFRKPAAINQKSNSMLWLAIKNILFTFVMM